MQYFSASASVFSTWATRSPRSAAGTRAWITAFCIRKPPAGSVPSSPSTRIAGSAYPMASFLRKMAHVLRKQAASAVRSSSSGLALPPEPPRTVAPANAIVAPSGSTAFPEPVPSPDHAALISKR